jgi:hypothetical protein
MNRLRGMLWCLLAWVAPAAVAGALGWQGIWGSGTALLDYLIPIPVAGGVLHLPSFGLMAVAVVRAPRWGPRGLQRWRALALSLAITGALMSFEGPGLRLTENPVGLFLLSDGVLATLALALAPQRPWLQADGPSLLLLLAPIALLAWVAWELSPRSRNFNVGTVRQGPTGREVTIFVQTRLRPDSAEFRSKALAWAVGAQNPAQWHGIDRAALYFSGELRAAIAGDQGQVFATLCQSSDGRAPRWLPGPGDCFEGSPDGPGRATPR